MQMRRRLDRDGLTCFEVAAGDPGGRYSCDSLCVVYESDSNNEQEDGSIWHYSISELNDIIMQSKSIILYFISI